MDQAFGIDVSQWQGSLDFRQIAAHSPHVEFMFARAGAGMYRDPMFPAWWPEIQGNDICRGAYHYIYPSLSIILQMDLFFKLVSPGEYDRLAVDFEVDQGLSRQQITDAVNQSLQICKDRTGRFPILYSRASWLTANVNMWQLPPVDLWLAQYRWPRPAPEYTDEYPSPPDLPPNVSTWLIHQTAEKGKGIGSESYYMDYDRWNGDREAVRAYFGYKDSFKVYLPIISVPKNLARVKKTVSPWLSVRKGPWVDPPVGKLGPGEEFEILGSGLDQYQNTWYRIGENRWVAGWLCERIG